MDATLLSFWGEERTLECLCCYDKFVVSHLVMNWDGTAEIASDMGGMESVGILQW